MTSRTALEGRRQVATHRRLALCAGRALGVALALGAAATCDVAWAQAGADSSWSATAVEVQARCNDAPEGFRHYVRVPLPARLPERVRELALEGPSMPQLRPSAEGACVPVLGLTPEQAATPGETPPAPKLPFRGELIWQVKGGKIHALVAPTGSLWAWQEPPAAGIAPIEDAAGFERAVLALGESRATTGAAAPKACFARLTDARGQTWALVEPGRMHVRLQAGGRARLLSIGQTSEGWKFSATQADAPAPSHLSLTWSKMPSSALSSRSRPVTLRWSARRDAPYGIGPSTHQTLELVFEDRCPQRIDPAARRGLATGLLYWLAH